MNIVIIGGSRGIGKAAARELLQDGNNVLIVGIGTSASFLVIHFLLISAAGALSFYLVGQPLKRSRILCLIFLFFHAFQVSFIADLLQFCILGFYLFF